MEPTIRLLRYAKKDATTPDEISVANLPHLCLKLVGNAMLIMNHNTVVDTFHLKGKKTKSAFWNNTLVIQRIETRNRFDLWRFQVHIDERQQEIDQFLKRIKVVTTFQTVEDSQHFTENSMDTSTDSATYDSYSFNCDNTFKVPEAVSWNLKPPVRSQWNPTYSDPSLGNLKLPVENQWSPSDTDPSLGNSISLFRGINFDEGSKIPSVHPQFEEGSRFEANQTLFQPQNQQGFSSDTDMFQVEEIGSFNAPYRHMLPPIIEDRPLDRSAASHSMNRIQFVPASSPGGQVQFNTNSGIMTSENVGKTPFNVAYGNIQASPTVGRRQVNANYSGMQFGGSIQASPTVERRHINANYSGIQSGNIQASPTVDRRHINANYSGIQSEGSIQASPTVERRQFNANCSGIQSGNIQASPTVDRRQFNANYSGIQSGNIQASPTVERRQLNVNYGRMQSPIQGRRLLDVSYRNSASSTPNRGTFETNRAVFPHSKQLISNNQSLPVNKTVLPSSFETNRGFPHSIQVLTTNNQSMPVNKTVLPNSSGGSEHQQILRRNEVNSAVFQQLNSGGMQLATNNQTAQTQFGDKIVPTNLAGGRTTQFFTKNETVPGQFGDRRQINTGNTSSIVVGDRVSLRTYSGIKAEGKISVKDTITGAVPLQFQDGRSVRPETVVDQSMTVDPRIPGTKMNNATMSPFGGGVIHKPNHPTMIRSNDGTVTNKNMVAPTIPDTKMNNATMLMSSYGGGGIHKQIKSTMINLNERGHSSTINRTFSGGAFNKENVKPSIDEERGNINQHAFQTVGERQSVRATNDILSCRRAGGENQIQTNNFRSPAMIGERKQTNTTNLSVPSLSSVSSTFVTPATIGGRNEFNSANMIGERKIYTTTDLSVPSLSSASNTFVTPATIGGRKDFNTAIMIGERKIYTTTDLSVPSLSSASNTFVTPTTVGGGKELFNPALPPQIDGAPTDRTSFANQVGQNQGTDEMRHMNMETDDGNNAMSQGSSQSSQNSHFLETFTLRKVDAAACLAEPVRLGPLLMREVLDQIPESLLIAALADPKLEEHFKAVEDALEQGIDYTGHSEKEILKAFFNSEAFLPFIEGITSILNNDNEE